MLGSNPPLSAITHIFLAFTSIPYASSATSPHEETVLARPANPHLRQPALDLVRRQSLASDQVSLIIRTRGEVFSANPKRKTLRADPARRVNSCPLLVGV